MLNNQQYFFQFHIYTQIAHHHPPLIMTTAINIAVRQKPVHINLFSMEIIETMIMMDTFTINLTATLMSEGLAKKD